MKKSGSGGIQVRGGERSRPWPGHLARWLREWSPWNHRARSNARIRPNPDTAPECIGEKSRDAPRILELQNSGCVPGFLRHAARVPPGRALLFSFLFIGGINITGHGATRTTRSAV